MKFSYSIIYQTALCAAIEKGNIEIVQLLLMNKKIDINITYKHIKINHKKKDMVEMTPLLFAIDQKQDIILQLFLSSELSSTIDINERSMTTTIGNKIFEQTALYLAIEKQNINAINLLLARLDIDVNKQSLGFYDKNQTEINAPLHLAAKIGNIEIIRLLLGKKDICINIEDKFGKKPIDYAKNQEIKQLLSK